MRCLIVTQDASVIIGKAGKHVNEIREKSGARVTVSESIPGNPERILNVSGALDAVSKAFGLIVRRINDEPFDVASVPGSRAVTIKFIIPNSRMGTIIGKGGSKIKEIQEASGARLNASEAMLPGSTERVLSVSGVADAIHIAVYYIGNILLEYQDRPAGRADSSSYRQAGVGSAPRADRYEPRGDRAAPVNAALAGPGVQTQTIYIPNDLVGSSMFYLSLSLTILYSLRVSCSHWQGRCQDQRDPRHLRHPDPHHGARAARGVDRHQRASCHHHRSARGYQHGCPASLPGGGLRRALPFRRPFADSPDPLPSVSKSRRLPVFRLRPSNYGRASSSHVP
jgi:predicted RNA-binding protein YlqC (UPF0109 family)